MGEFEFLFSFFGLLLGLTVAEVTVKFADSIDAHKRRPIGFLTPSLALFVLLDVTSFWLYSWSLRDWVQISWRTVFSGLALAVAYFLSASLIFPRSEGGWASLDEHYWARKRMVVGGVMAVNLFVIGLQLSRAMPRWSDGWFFFYQSTYFIPLAVLLLSRRRIIDLVMLAILNLTMLISAFDLLPGSQWAVEVGISSQASTSTAGASK